MQTETLPILLHNLAPASFGNHPPNPVISTEESHGLIA